MLEPVGSRRSKTAAAFAFRGFDQLSYDVVSAVRSFTVVDPLFGPVVFTAILTNDGVGRNHGVRR